MAKKQEKTTPQNKYKVFVVPETHWDREWYSTFQQFRIRLVKLTDKLLRIMDENKKYTVYTFDGQTVVLEDYLEIRPETELKLRKYVKSGKILVGPWYVLPDEFLVSGEAVIRNIMIGHKIGAEFGGVNKAGYIPDPFGHLSQIPQLMAGFGIDHVIFTRGVGDGLDTTEFTWESPDGTRSLAIHQVRGYGNFAHPPEDNVDKLVEYAQRRLDELKPFQATDNVLFNNGVDHVEPYPKLPRYLKILDERIPEAEFVQASFTDYANAVKAAKPKLLVHRGELRCGKFHPLLPGVLSARMYLKQLNDQCQTLMERWAEPACAMAWALTSEPYPGAFLWHAWKQIIRNHPHDSICGCSIDEVHQDMIPRFKAAREIGEDMTQAAFSALCSRIGGPMKAGAGRITIFNTCGSPRHDLMEIKIPDSVAEPFEIASDEDGRAVEFVLIRKNGAKTAQFVVPVSPSFGYRSYSVKPAEKPVKVSLKPIAKNNALENEYLKVKINPNGGFDLLDKTTRVTYKNLNIFEDVADAGDEYDFSHIKDDKPLTTSDLGARLKVLESSPFKGVIRVSLLWKLPRNLSADRKSRSDAAIAIPIQSDIILIKGARRVEIVTRIKNLAEDHRLRALFPSGIKSRVSSAMGVFDVVERNVDIPKTQGWEQAPQPCQPQQDFVDVSDDKKGLGVLNHGLPEFEILKSPGGNIIALTLLRCMGWLSRGDLLTRRGNAGPSIPTPDAQMIGEWEFNYAVYPHAGDWEAGAVALEAASYKSPSRPFVQWAGKDQAPSDKNYLAPPGMRLLELWPDSVTLSAFKGAESGKGLIARVWNASAKKITATMKWGIPSRKISLVNLNEEPVKGGRIQLGPDSRTVKFDMRPFEITTVLWEK